MRLFEEMHLDSHVVVHEEPMRMNDSKELVNSASDLDMYGANASCFWLRADLQMQTMSA